VGRKLRRALLALSVLIGGIGGSIAYTSPAMANLSHCYTNSICAYQTFSSFPVGTNPGQVVERDAADTPRNTCFTGFGTRQTITVVNNSQYRWYLFRTTTCSGSHIEVGPFDEIHTPAGWDLIHGWYRTSSLS